MPRKSREISGTGIYHVMMRGTNRQNIFEDREDYLRFLSILGVTVGQALCEVGVLSIIWH